MSTIFKQRGDKVRYKDELGKVGPWVRLSPTDPNTAYGQARDRLKALLS